MNKAGYGINVYDEINSVNVSDGGNLWCDKNLLTELHLDSNKDILGVFCYDNLLTKLRIPHGVKLVECDNNKIEFLYLPDGILDVFCDGNKLKDLDIPSSVKTLMCDKDLFEYDKCKIETVDIIYDIFNR
jgi:hypothetical protein